MKKLVIISAVVFLVGFLLGMQYKAYQIKKSAQDIMGGFGPALPF